MAPITAVKRRRRITFLTSALLVNTIYLPTCLSEEPNDKKPSEQPEPPRISPSIPQSMIYGTAWKKEETYDLTLTALKTGFRGIDTANFPRHYEEKLVGDAIRDSSIPRDELFIQTKFTPDACDESDEKEMKTCPYDIHASLPDQVKQSFESSLRHLDVSYIDSYILHSPLPTMEQTLTVWSVMESYQTQGLIKRLGISNIGVNDLEDLYYKSEIKPTFVQNRCSGRRFFDQEVRGFCHRRDITYQGYGLLAPSNQFLVEDPLTEKIARHHGMTEQQVVYLYFQQGMNMLTLSGSKNAHHMEAAYHTKDMLLYMDEMETINRVVRPPKYDSSFPMTVTFINDLEEDTPVKIFWVGGKQHNREVLNQGILEGRGKETEIKTFHGHHFVFTEGEEEDGTERIVKSWMADREDGENQKVHIDRTLACKFLNDSKEHMELFWTTPDGREEVSQGDLLPGTELNVNTFLDHDFRVRKKRDGHLMMTWKASVDLENAKSRRSDWHVINHERVVIRGHDEL